MATSSATESWMERSLTAAPPGDAVRKSFEAEAMPHLADLMRTAARMTGNRAGAEDVVQEVYLEAWKSFHRYEPGTNCRAWLFKILLYKVQHHRRRWFRLRLFSESEESFANNLTFTPPVAERLTDEDMLAALDRVPADFRAVVLLVDIEEFSYKETAGILGVPIGTVMSRLSRGRRGLREHLEGVARSYGFGGTDQKGQQQ
jgi:RNA polymerase sigma-70 factor (ECF subfamily)